jgi:hypothetical protein
MTYLLALVGLKIETLHALGVCLRERLRDGAREADVISALGRASVGRW